MRSSQIGVSPVKVMSYPCACIFFWEAIPRIPPKLPYHSWPFLCKCVVSNGTFPNFVDVLFVNLEFPRLLVLDYPECVKRMPFPALFPASWIGWNHPSGQALKTWPCLAQSGDINQRTIWLIDLHYPGPSNCAEETLAVACRHFSWPSTCKLRDIYHLIPLYNIERL